MAVPLQGAHANVAQTPVAVSYTGQILRPYGWFTHFPRMAAGGFSRLWLHAPGLVNPTLSLLLLLITAAISRRCYSVETGRALALFCSAANNNLKFVIY
ncbi:MAG: hypothetical protein WBP52_21830 [Terriglobales bacterium]|jgi:hypothetical protein